MIKIQVKLYPPFSYYARERQTEVELNEGDRFEDLLLRLADMFPDMKEAIPEVGDKCIFYNNIFPVMNNRVVQIGEVLKDGDVISLFGSISGG